MARKPDQEKYNLQEALRPITSLISKSEKAQRKVTPGTWQHTMLRDNLKALHITSALMGKKGDDVDNFTQDDLQTALHAFASMIDKSENALKKFTSGTSQYTLLRNRLKALRVASSLITDKAKESKIVKRNSPIHRAWALEAAKQAKKVLPFFEKEHPNDDRPRQAIKAIKAWAEGKRELSLKEVRKLSLGSHAAAREAKTDAARFAARAAGQAVAIWHVPTHATAVPSYVAKAIVAYKNSN